MIKLERAIDGRFSKKFWGAGKKKAELDLLKRQRKFLRGEIKPKKRFKSSFWKSAKNRLKKESNEKCAYCETRFSVTGFGDVEHYRPKSIYWWLAYSYNNYAVSCQVCNQSFKRNRFPILGNRLAEPQVTAQSTDDELDDLSGKLDIDLKDISDIDLNTFVFSHEAEDPLIFHPYYDEAKDSYAYKISVSKKEIEIIPANDSAKLLVENAEECLGINRPEIKEMRFLHSIPYWQNKRFLEGTLLPSQVKECQEFIDVFVSGTLQYTGMYRFFEHNPPNPLPVIPARMLMPQQ